MTSVVICGIALLASLILLVFVTAFSVSTIEKLQTENYQLKQEIAAARREAARFQEEIVDFVRGWESTVLRRPK